jgi:hypothetical protein
MTAFHEMPSCKSVVFVVERFVEAGRRLARPVVDTLTFNRTAARLAHPRLTRQSGATTSPAMSLPVVRFAPPRGFTARRHEAEDSASDGLRGTNASYKEAPMPLVFSLRCFEV